MTLCVLCLPVKDHCSIIGRQYWAQSSFQGEQSQVSLCDVHDFWQCCYPRLWHLWISGDQQMYLCMKSASGLRLHSTLFLLTLSFCVSVMQLIIPGLKTAQRLWLSTRSLSLISCPPLLSPANWRQPRCQFHGRVASSAAEIIHCKIDLNNRKVERHGKAGEWNWESLLPFWTCLIVEEELGCAAYRECQLLNSWYRDSDATIQS